MLNQFFKAEKLYKNIQIEVTKIFESSNSRRNHLMKYSSFFWELGQKLKSQSIEIRKLYRGVNTETCIIRCETFFQKI